MQLSANMTGLANFTVTVAATTVYLTPSQVPTSTTLPATLTTSASVTGATATLIANPMLQIEQLLSRAPQCIQPAAIPLAFSTGCGADRQCICEDKMFMASLMGAMQTKCIPTEWHETQSWISQLCPRLKESRTAVVDWTVAVLEVLAVISVILRVISRRIGNVKIWWDDYLIFAACVISIGEAINIFSSTTVGGSGKHFILLSAQEITSYLKSFWVVQFLFAFSTTLIKLSILLFYRRIFVSRPMRIMLIITGAGVIAWFFAQLISVLLSCRPLPLFWDKTIPNGTCINENNLSYAVTAANLLTDLVIFIIPIPPLMKLQRSLAQRLSLIALFLVGAFVCIAAIVRLPLLVQLDVRDLTYTIVPAAIWINLETKLGILCACLPTMKPLFHTVSTAMQSHFTRLGSYGSGSGSGSGSRSGSGRSTNQEGDRAVIVDTIGKGKTGGNGRGWASAALKKWPEDKEEERAREQMREKV